MFSLFSHHLTVVTRASGQAIIVQHPLFPFFQDTSLASRGAQGTQGVPIRVCDLLKPPSHGEFDLIIATYFFQGRR